MSTGTRGTHGTLLLEGETFAVRGAAFEIYKELRDGYLEAVYQECLRKEFVARGIPHAVQPKLAISYKGDLLEATYSPDFVCFDRLIVEIKAVQHIAPEHRAQTVNYLKTTGLAVGLLVNFGAPAGVEIERIVRHFNSA